MVVVIIGMLVCIVLALIVVGLVALPARRQGEALFIDRSHARTAAGVPAEPAAPDAPAEATETAGDVAAAPTERPAPTAGEANPAESQDADSKPTKPATGKPEEAKPTKPATGKPAGASPVAERS